jgi:threonine synthase
VLAAMRGDFDAASADMAEVARCIRRTHSETGYLLDPHSACALVALDKTPDPGRAPRVVLATAHPAKFPDAMEAITGKRPALPPRLSSLLSDPERVTALPNDLAAVQSFITARARSRQGAIA